MTQRHREVLLREFPSMSGTIQLLSRTGSDVIDPIGSGLEEYRRCADQIEKHIQDIIAESY